MVDSNGNVGIIKGDATLYDFFFQLEVVAGMTAEEVDDNLLPEVEVAIANSLVPDLFPKQCGRRRNLQGSNGPGLQGRYLGLSTRPPDFVLNGCKSGSTVDRFHCMCCGLTETPHLSPVCPSYLFWELQ